MKRLLFILLFSSWLCPVNAQFWDNNFIYYSGDVNYGNYFGADINLNYIYKSNYSFKIGQTFNIRKARTQPESYVPGLFGMFRETFGYPLDQLENYSVSAGKIFNLNDTRTLRLNLSIGAGYTVIKEPHNWQKIDKQLFSPTHSWEYRKYSTMSFIVNPKIEFPFTRYFGVTLSPIVEINKDRTHFGIGIGIMAGLLRKKNYP